MTFKEYSKRIVVNGHKVTVAVKVEVHDEQDQSILLDQDFENAQQRKAYVAKLESGEIFAGYIVATATAEGLEGTDAIGGCELRPNNMFNSTPFNKSVRGILKHYSPESNALAELKKALQQEYSLLSKRAENFKRFAE